MSTDVGFRLQGRHSVRRYLQLRYASQLWNVKLQTVAARAATSFPALARPPHRSESPGRKWLVAR